MNIMFAARIGYYFRRLYRKIILGKNLEECDIYTFKNWTTGICIIITVISLIVIVFFR